MRYWWTNQKQTYEAEMAGGYLWSPRHRSDGSRNPFYENLRLARTGDMVFAYHDSAIRAVGIVLAEARESVSPLPPAPPRPNEKAVAPFVPGWLLEVAWLKLATPFLPTRHMNVLEPLLPSAHSPLSPSGRGLQGGRLLELPQSLALVLLQLTAGRSPRLLLGVNHLPQQMKFSFD
jgi:hypothetical protein